MKSGWLFLCVVCTVKEPCPSTACSLGQQLLGTLLLPGLLVCVNKVHKHIVHNCRCSHLCLHAGRSLHKNNQKGHETQQFEARLGRTWWKHWTDFPKREPVTYLFMTMCFSHVVMRFISACTFLVSVARLSDNQLQTPVKLTCVGFESPTSDTRDHRKFDSRFPWIPDRCLSFCRDEKLQGNRFPSVHLKHTLSMVRWSGSDTQEKKTMQLLCSYS